MNETRSCLTDKPLQTVKQDSLNARDYALALCDFIINADTPVTIGIQGGWGSGKTSLISVMQEQLNGDEQHTTLCVLVNAWEHSLFHSADSKADVALSLLNGLSEGVEKSANESAWVDQQCKQALRKDGEKINTAINGLKTGLLFAGKVALHAGLNWAGLGGLPDDRNKKQEDDSNKTPEIPPLAKYVHTLRESLQKLICSIKYQSRQVKVIFFIDDLDRVPPATAVEILDITKNIFDIPNCVFVLAIDYDVVVKGLQEKFGEKTKENEREFRQYFDKIIQIPFTMPVGAYMDNLRHMLKPALERLGNNVVEDTGDRLIANLAEDAQLATGGIPRSIKRIINTLSLLQHIAKSRSKKGNDDAPSNLEARFIVVALHINFPEICRRLMEKPDFPKWKLQELDFAWQLEAEKNKHELEILGQSHLFDDEWEKVVYCLCCQSEWLKGKARNVSQLLNNLMDALNGKKDAKALDKSSLEVLEKILSDIRVVSIDSETAAVAPPIDDSSVKTDHITVFCKELNNALSTKLTPALLPPSEDGIYAARPRGTGGDRSYRMPFTDGDYELELWWSKEDSSLTVFIIAPLGECSKKKAKPVLEKLAGEDFTYGFEDKAHFYFGKSIKVASSRALPHPPTPDFIDAGMEVWQIVQKAEKELENA